MYGLKLFSHLALRGARASLEAEVETLMEQGCGKEAERR